MIRIDPVYMMILIFSVVMFYIGYFVAKALSKEKIELLIDEINELKRKQ